MTDRNVTLNDFFISMKHLFHPIHANYSTFAAENSNKSTNFNRRKKQMKQTFEHSRQTGSGVSH